MIESLYLDGVQLHDTETVTVVEFSLGSPTPRESRAARPSAHGSIDVTRWYDGRVFELRGEVWAGNAADFWTAVDTLKGAFRLSSALRVLKWTREGLTYAERAEVRVASELTMPLRGGTWYTEWGVSLFAPDPRMYADTESTGSYDPTDAGTGSGVSLPMDFPLVFEGASTANLAVTNGGTIETPPTLTVSGPITNPIIDNDTTGESVYTTGLALLSGETLVVDVATRTVTVNSGDGTSYIDASRTRWFELQPGENLLRLRGSGMTSGATALSCTHRDARV